jgi:hypothetical protein
LQCVAEAATDVPIEPLAIRLQCGCALTDADHRIGDDQRRPLERVIEAFQQIWGSPPRGVPRWNAPILRGAMP